MSLMDILARESWSPYAVGIGIGLLGTLAFLLSDKPLGCSTSFSSTAGMIHKLFNRRKVEENPYYKNVPPVVDWQWMLVLGVLIGGFLSATLSGQFQLAAVPGLWAETFGPSPAPRMIAAVIGGIIMGVGARWAGGCTSGHGISGTLQLAISSWVAAACFFVGGIVTAMILYRIIGS